MTKALTRFGGVTVLVGDVHNRVMTKRKEKKRKEKRRDGKIKIRKRRKGTTFRRTAEILSKK